MAADVAQQPMLVAVDKPLSLIPVSLKEAALDSPTFRATVVHYLDQVDLVERWLEGYCKAATKLAQEVNVLEGVVNTLLISANPPTQLSEAIVDHDYTVLAMRRYGEGAREFWSHAIGGFKKTQHSIIDPIKATLHTEFRAFKEIRRQFEQMQKSYDSLLTRYYAQAKSKEPSAFREDAFQLHEARRAYLKSSMDFCVQAPQLRATLDSILIKVFSDQWLEMKDLRETSLPSFDAHLSEFGRIRAWNKEMAQGDKVLKRELNAARKQIEESAEIAARPSRDLDAYSVAPVASLGSRSPAVKPQAVSEKGHTPASKQGWLFMRTLAGRPARTSWVRRWFFVISGIFGWLIQGPRSGGVEESEKIGVLLSSVRAAPQEDRRFCFEIKTKDTTLLLQAETQFELTQWLSVFEVAKQKALEEPVSTDARASGGNPSSDAAFAVSPPIAPELAAKRPDGQIANISDDAISTLSTIDLESTPVRASFDVTSLRRNTLDNRENESTRDHAAKILQKLDLHRKSTAGSQLSGETGQPGPPSSTMGGIASLISASHASLPAVLGGPVAAGNQASAAEIIPSSTLAPTTFVNPPAPTNLSKTSVMIGIERGFDLGVVDSRGGVPSSLMANQWGTANYGYISRLERGELSKPRDRTISQLIGRPNRGVSDSSKQIEALDISSYSENASEHGVAESPAHSTTSFVPSHRKTISDASGPTSKDRALTGFADYPEYYPQALRRQDAQLRMLFPNVLHNDRVVLVFRASWNPDEHQDLPGRVYVTMNDFYFYSNHMGFVLVSGTSLSRVLDVSASSNRLQDHIYLRIEGRSGRNDTTVISIKTYLEPLKMLQRRLTFLVSNSTSKNPIGLEEMMKVLLNMESDIRDDISDSWENGSPSRSYFVPQQRGRETKPSLRVDRSLFGGDPTTFAESTDVIKFKLPTQPVTYAPRGMSNLSVQSQHDVSAKALFHIMFGDRSVLFQILYFQRRTRVVKQCPWTAIDQAHWTRKFEYSIDAVDKQHQSPKTMIVDSQTIDVANDHLCYVVTDRKTPWHLPHAEDFSLVTKLVITHTAKSKSKLAIFTKVEWTKDVPLFQGVIERQALDDLSLDAHNMDRLISDQVHKLGANCHTNKAIRIFGHIGHQTDANQISAPDIPLLGKESTRVMTYHSLSGLVVEAGASFARNIISAFLTTTVTAATTLIKPLTAHTLLLILLLSSISLHLFRTSELAHNWWTDRSAAAFMSRLGIGPNTIMSKAVYLHDLHDLITPSFPLHPTNTSNSCATTFERLFHDLDLNSLFFTSSSTSFTTSPTLRTARRLQRSRQRLGTYRHDLLVSLRLINNIERETIRAEYENWVLEENAKCRQVGSLLQSDGSKTNATDGRGEEERAVEREKLGRVRGFWERYCADCGVERDVALALDGFARR